MFCQVLTRPLWAPPAELSRRAHSLLRDLVGPEECISRSPRGRPLAVGASVSISHTKGYIAAARCAGGKVGIDLSGPEDLPHLSATGPTFLSAQEAQVVEQMTGPTQLEHLQSLWVLKEALLKGVGIGLGLDPASLPFTIGPDGWTCPTARRWRFEVRQIAPGFVCAVAIKSEHPQIDWGVTTA